MVITLPCRYSVNLSIFKEMVQRRLLLPVTAVPWSEDYAESLAQFETEYLKQLRKSPR
ncbi:MAG: hypothetical protein R2864_02630 [Syntrophotaleaceae bacterium]